MATNFPTSIDSLTNPEAGNALNNPSHSEQHINSNDAIEALQAKVGANSSAVESSHDFKLSTVTGSNKAETQANKRTSFQTTPTDTAYPSEKLVKDSLDAKIDKSLVDAKGDIITATADNTPARLGVGDNGKVLTANSSTATGLEWATPAGSGDVIAPATNTDSYIPQWNGANSKTLKDGLAVPAGGLAGITALDGKLTNSMATNKLLGRGTASTGVIEEITLGTNLSLSGTTLNASGGGTSLWTAITGTRASNTTITVATDLTAIFKKGMIVRWQESGNDKVGMVSIPSTYSAPNTTITIIGDTCASIDANSFKYSVILGTEPYIARFAVAGNIGAVADDVANAYYATEPMRVIGADLQVGTAGTTNNTTIDIDKATTSMFTTKPTLATTVASSPTPFTADTATSLALGDRVRINIDAIQTTNAIDLYVQLYLFPTRFLTLS